jgi:hypothetical protein
MEQLLIFKYSFAFNYFLKKDFYEIKNLDDKVLQILHPQTYKHINYTIFNHHFKV